MAYIIGFLVLAALGLFAFLYWVFCSSFDHAVAQSMKDNDEARKRSWSDGDDAA